MTCESLYHAVSRALCGGSYSRNYIGRIAASIMDADVTLGDDLITVNKMIGGLELNGLMVFYMDWAEAHDIVDAAPHGILTLIERS